jgi:hypothetical protein
MTLILMFVSHKDREGDAACSKHPVWNRALPRVGGATTASRKHNCLAGRCGPDSLCYQTSHGPRPPDHTDRDLRRLNTVIASFWPVDSAIGPCVAHLRPSGPHTHHAKSANQEADDDRCEHHSRQHKATFDFPSERCGLFGMASHVATKPDLMKQRAARRGWLKAPLSATGVWFGGAGRGWRIVSRNARDPSRAAMTAVRPRGRTLPDGRAPNRDRRASIATARRYQKCALSECFSYGLDSFTPCSIVAVINSYPQADLTGKSPCCRLADIRRPR